MLGTCPRIQGSSQDIWSPHPRPQEAAVLQEPPQSLPPSVPWQNQETEGLQHIHLLLASLFLVASKARSPAYPLLRPSFVCLSVCLPSRNQLLILQRLAHLGSSSAGPLMAVLTNLFINIYYGWLTLPHSAVYKLALQSGRLQALSPDTAAFSVVCLICV